MLSNKATLKVQCLTITGTYLFFAHNIVRWAWPGSAMLMSDSGAQAAGEATWLHGGEQTPGSSSHPTQSHKASTQKANGISTHSHGWNHVTRPMPKSAWQVWGGNKELLNSNSNSNTGYHHHKNLDSLCLSALLFRGYQWNWGYYLPCSLPAWNGNSWFGPDRVI